MAFSKNRRLADLVSSAGEVSSFVDASVTHADLHTSMDLTGKTVTVANASTGDSDTTAANTAFVQQEIAALVDSAPGTLNTLNELAAALGDDASFSTTVTNSIATKLPLAGGAITGSITFDNNVQAIKIKDAAGTAGYVLYQDNGDTLVVGNGTTVEKIRLDTSGNEGAITVDTDGKVGIGTTSPATQLQLLKTGESMIRMGYSTTQYGQVGRNSDGTYEFSCYENGGVIKFGTSTSNNATTERMRIDSTGRVGINRTPAISNSKLEVGGADNVPLINVEASGATAGVGIGSSRMKFYYGTAEKASIDSSGNLRTARQIIQENSDGTPRFINIPFSSAGSGFTFDWDDLANHSAVGDQTAETNAFMFEVNVTSYLFRRVKALIIVDTNADNSIAVHTIHSSTLTCSASIPTGSQSITITIGGLWGNSVNYMGRITTF